MSLLSRALLNVFWSEKFISEEKLLNILDRLTKYHNEDPISVDEALKLLKTESFEALGFEIRKKISENDGKLYFVLCNLRSDELAKMATHFNADSITIFKNIIKDLVSSGEGKLLRKDIIKKYDVNRTINSEKILNIFIEDGWLELIDNDSVALSVRTISELGAYIKENYESIIKECIICSETVIRGEDCKNQTCLGKIHFHCAREWFDSHSKDCPACKNRWHN